MYALDPLTLTALVASPTSSPSTFFSSCSCNALSVRSNSNQGQYLPD
jgi:hypothetical protein